LSVGGLQVLDPAPDTADSDKKKISFAVPDSEKDKEREQKEKESKEDKKRIPDDSLATERRMKRVQMSSPELARKSPDVARKSPPPASARSPSPVRAVDEEQGGSGRKTRYQVFFFSFFRRFLCVSFFSFVSFCSFLSFFLGGRHFHRTFSHGHDDYSWLSRVFAHAQKGCQNQCISSAVVEQQKRASNARSEKGIGATSGAQRSLSDRENSGKEARCSNSFLAWARDSKVRPHDLSLVIADFFFFFVVKV
jgi:hypothetical protein